MSKVLTVRPSTKRAEAYDARMKPLSTSDLNEIADRFKLEQMSAFTQEVFENAYHRENNRMSMNYEKQFQNFCEDLRDEA